MRLARLLTNRNPDRELAEVHVYRGCPDSHVDPRGHSANVKQSQAWAKAGVTVHPRQLRYINGNPEEKGVDVEMAVAFTSMAMRGVMEVAILFTADTDLLPAVDEVRRHTAVHVEVAGWHNGSWGQRINASPPLWCHWLNEADYRAVEDTMDYNL